MSSCAFITSGRPATTTTITGLPVASRSSIELRLGGRRARACRRRPGPRRTGSRRPRRRSRRRPGRRGRVGAGGGDRRVVGVVDLRMRSFGPSRAVLVSPTGAPCFHTTDVPGGRRLEALAQRRHFGGTAAPAGQVERALPADGPAAELVVQAVGLRARDEDPLRVARQRQRAVVARAARGSRAAAFLASRRAAGSSTAAFAAFGVDVRVLEQPELELQRQDRATASSIRASGSCPSLDRLGQSPSCSPVASSGIIDMSMPALTARDRVLHVGGDVVLGDQVLDVLPVGDHDALEAAAGRAARR